MNVLLLIGTIISIVITVLLFLKNRQSRIQLAATERKLIHFNEYYNLLSEASAAVNHVSIDELDSIIEIILESVAKYEGLDRIFLVSFEDDVMKMSFQFCSEGVPPIMERNTEFLQSDFSWWYQQISNGQVIDIQNIDDIKDDAPGEYRILKKTQTAKILAVPIVHADEIGGFIAVESHNENKQWSENIYNMLSSTGQIINNARQRIASENVFAINDQRFSELMNNLDQVFFLLNADLNEIIYVSNSFSRIWGFPIRDLLDKPSTLFSEIAQAVVFTEDFNVAVSRGDAFHSEAFLNTTKKWLDIRAYPVRNRHGLVYRYACVALDITILKEKEIKLARAQDYEFEIAARVQKQLLLGSPDKSLEGIEIAEYSVPSKSVDGDFYDFHNLSEHTVDFVVGDVMGKGIAAALMGAAAKSALLKGLYESADQAGALPAITKILGKTDAIIAPELLSLNSFITLYYARFDNINSILEFVDCGHTPFMYYDSHMDTCFHVKGNNMPMGFIEGQEYSPYAIPLLEKDICFFYSDGLTEVSNNEDEMFGEERLQYLVKSHNHLPPGELIQTATNLVFQFSHEGFQDDVTCVVMKQNKNPVLDMHTFSYTKTAYDFLTQLEKDLYSLDADIKQECLSELHLAIHEACVNIIRYSNHPNEEVSITYRKLPYYYYFSIDYKGIEFDWYQQNDPEIESYQEGGYGLYLLRQLTDHALFFTGDHDSCRISILKRCE